MGGKQGGEVGGGDSAAVGAVGDRIGTIQLTIIPLNLDEANALVERWHRHHKPVPGAKFAIGVADGAGVIIGAAICGRPVARHLDTGFTLEVYRVVTDGTKNACSALYGACWRVAKALGYIKLITYTLVSEPGTSLKAAGWKLVGECGGGSWNRPNRPRVDTAPTCQKKLWEAAN